MTGNSIFSWLDWIVMALMFIAIIWISWSSSKHTKTQKDYLLGGKSMKVGLVGLSLFATLTSTLGYLSVSGELIKYGPVYLTCILAFPFAGWIVGRFMIPKIMEYNVTSAYEILELKLGKKSRRLATVFFIALRYMWMCTIVFATVRTAVVPILGISEALTPLICALMILFTVFFTTFGGLKAVVATDALQAVVMFAGAALTIAIILCKVGLSPEVWNADMFAHWQKIDFAPRINVRMTVANIFLMTLCWQVCTAGSDQMAIQRYLSVKDVPAARKTYNISLISTATIKILLGAVGVLVMAYFTKFPGQMPDGATITSNADRLFPHFIRIGLPAGITGMIMAAIVAAAISSLSSGLNSVSSVIQEDILKTSKRFRNYDFSLKSIKIISVLLGLAVLGGSFIVGYVHGNLMDITMKVVNLVVSPLFVLFFMAMFSPIATDRGTMVGGFAALAAAIAVSFFGIFGFVQTWNLFAGLAVGIPSGMLASLVDKKVLNR